MSKRTSTAKESIAIDSEIARAWTLPSHLYAEPDAYGAEVEKIFRRSWQVVGHHDQVASAGDYFTTELVGEPLLVVHGGDGKLRGFYNVCRHRAGRGRMRFAQTLSLRLPRMDVWPGWGAD